MTRLERILDGLGVADDAIAPIRARLRRRHAGRGRGPSDEEVMLCASLLRSAAATMVGALTLPDAAPAPEASADRPESVPPDEGDFWFRRGAMS